ncbi:LamG-like jellyroll fold domain-containing protein [Streptomyces sp. Wb2n-11]|uniref:LamG-like jellyroll fold domain-containing protein n=1 Tax=Streptomyces sp. Wb2n-11 TaxID=1030533 RepID=UPI000A4351CD|nr:LamG-like jellyroll fold domain-containing protein [Streptomyces sp. Wb2n-11]
MAPVAQRVETADEAETGAAPHSEAEAFAEAKRSGKAVEVSSLRGETSEVYATPEGDLEAREYLRPVWARAGGAWKPVDTDLTVAADGMVAPKAATVEVAFSGGGKGPMVRLKKAGREMELSWPKPLPKPTLEGDTATYAHVLPGVDLRLIASPEGFSHLLVVKSAKAAASNDLAKLRLKLAAHGLEIKETAEGGLQALDAGAKNAVFEASTPVMWDSSEGENASAARTSATRTLAAANDDQTRGEPGAGESGQLAPVGVEIPADGDELVLTPDTEVLKGKDTVYPVFIDPQWYSPRATSWTMASKYWASSPQWKFNGKSTEGVGYCGWSYCAPHDTKRVFYQIPVSKFAGKSILSAEFVVRNTWSASCADRSVELWQTKGISTSTTWNSQNASGFWVKELSSKSFAYGYEGCEAKDAEFSVRSAVQAAADGRDPSMTFGLRASNESDADAWKRFSDKAFLRVKYNRPPSQVKMSQLSMEYSDTCKRPGSAKRIRSLGKIHADKITDPDGDRVSVQFQATWDGGAWKPSLTSAKSSGSDFSISLPSSIPENKEVNWHVRTYDGAQYSPWSYAGDPTGCYFYYDTKAPRSPTISSDEYPASNTEDPDDPWFDGMGKYGTFEIKANDTQVTKYWYGLNVNPSSSNSISTASGAAKTLRILPPKIGVNTLYVSSLDAAGNVSAATGYRFRVKAGQPERAAWSMDEGAGATEAKGDAGVYTASLSGGPALKAPGAKGTAVTFDGVDDYAKTDIPTVSTETGFSVSAWAKLSKAPDGAAIIAAQPGNHAPGFELYYSKAYDRWAFNQYQADTADAGITRVMQASAGGATVGKWTHLVGTYSATYDEMKLYVDGELAGTITYDSPWDARRGLQIGAGSYSGKPGSFFPGSIDELQIFDKPLAQGEVTRLNGKESLISARPARAVFPMDEEAASTTLTGTPEVIAARYQGAPTTGAAGVAGAATTFDGQDDYASTGRPLVNNLRSFAVSAWVKLPKTKPDHAAIIATQAGTHKPGFELYYSAAYDRWAFNQYSADTPDATPIRAVEAEGRSARGGEWVHVAGVHDTVANTLTLYVNGTPAGPPTSVSSTWYAGGAVQIGAGSYDGQPGAHFPGQIDDVRLFDRPVSAGEVQQLFKQRPLVKNRWKFEETAGTSPVTTPDAAGTGNGLTLYGGASKSDAANIDFGALQLNGTSGYAATSTVPVDTSGSFTLTAWAQAAAMPKDAVAVASAEGSKQSAFAVRFVPDAAAPEANHGRWQLSVADKDATDAAVVKADNGEFYDAREWNHLALAYDGFAKEARLYVNGVLAEVTCQDADGNGENDDPACADLVPWAEDALAFKAASLQVGRSGTGTRAGDYFPGMVDDTWIFQGALTDDQVAKLATSWFDVPTKVPGD